MFPDNIYLSALLRLAQFTVTATLDFTDLRLGTMADRLIVEARLLSIKSLADSFLLMAISTVLMERSLTIAPSRWLPLLVEFETLLGADSDIGCFARALPSVEHGLSGFTVPQFLFVSRATALTSVKDLSELFEQLGLLDAHQRDSYLSALESPGTGARLMINSPWVAQQDRGGIDWAKASVQFGRLAAIARQWGHSAIAAECYCAQAVVLDEHACNPGAALAALDEAEKVYPGELRFARQRARVHYRNREHEASLKAFSPDDQNLAWMDNVDRAFFLREAGISAAETDRLDEASQLFARAQRCAGTAGDHMRPMAMGLLADRAVVEFKIGDRGAALNLLVQALEQAESIDPALGKKEKWCLAILGHIILWMRSQAGDDQWRGQQMPIVFGCGSNPEPSEEITQRPSPPTLLIWYQLAALEFDLGDHQGVLGALRDRTAGGVFAVHELGLEHQTISRAIQRSDTEPFFRSLPRYVSILAHLSLHRDSIEREDPRSPSLAKVLTVDPKDWPDSACVLGARDAILAFVATALLADRVGPYVELVRRIDSLVGARCVLQSLFESIDSRTLTAKDQLDVAGGFIARMAQEHVPIDPGDMFWGTCSIWSWLKRSQFRSLAEVTSPITWPSVGGQPRNIKSSP